MQSNNIPSKLGQFHSKKLQQGHINTITILKEFGKLLKQKRVKLGYTRTALAEALLRKKKPDSEISSDQGKIRAKKRRQLANTIANWEKGKCFIKKLSLIIEIYYETEIYVPHLLHQAIVNILNRRK